MVKPAGRSQLKAAFFIFLLFSAHAYRLDTQRDAQKAVASVMTFSNVSAAQVPFNLGSLRGVGYAQTTARYGQQMYRVNTVRQTATGASSMTSLASMSDVCLPGMYRGMTLKPTIAPNPGLNPVWPLLLATAVVLMGGLYLYHRHRLNSALIASFCPVSSWEADPAGLLVGPAAFGAFSELQNFTSADAANSRGMPRCAGLKRHRLRTQCDGDVDCKRQACRQMCCDRRDCTFFQFNNIDSTDYCYLGSRSRLGAQSCEQPWFGETCTSCRARRVQLWQVLGTNSKCSSSLFGTGFHVANQYECQSHASEVGHEYYQFDESRSMCETAASCDSPSTNTVYPWKIFSRDGAAVPEPSEAQVAPESETWQHEPFLFHEHNEHTGMVTVRLNSVEECLEGDVTCMRDVCRSKCLDQTGCIHYQFMNTGNECRLGSTHVIEEDNVGMWFGSILTHNRLCAAEEFKCPSSENCVKTCEGCSGFRRDGPDNYCVRDAIENMVDLSMWSTQYNSAPIDTWCRGLERTPVTMSANMVDGQTGADICRAACSSDTSCVLYQMYPEDSARTDYTEGSHVRCWLGMEDPMGRPLFSCTGRTPAAWRLISSPTAEAIENRGCQEGKVACVLTHSCVDLCQDECPGFTETDPVAGLCQPPADPLMRDDGVPMKIAVAGNLPSVQTNPDMAKSADEGDLFTISVNVQRIIDPDNFGGDTTAVCDIVPGAECDLIDGACVCEYDDDQTCDSLFGSPNRVVPLLAEAGMLLLHSEGCSCTGKNCNLSLLNSVPPVRVDESETAAIRIGSDEWELCSDDVVCPNMDSCAPLKYGAHGCGYRCQKETKSFWCSSRCACNQEEAVIDCAAGVLCPGMDKCDPISYGEYGCGYGCTKDTSFYFCSDNCGECNM